MIIVGEFTNPCLIIVVVLYLLRDEIITLSPITWNKERPEGAIPPGTAEKGRCRNGAPSLGGLLILFS